MKRKTFREIQDYAHKRGWRIAITPRMVERRKERLLFAKLRGAELRFAHLNGANLRCAKLRNVNLRDAFLSDADLRYADLRYADLRSTGLSDTNLYNARLDGVTMNWKSHDLIAERLRQAAGYNVQRRMIAGLVLMSRDWCWDKVPTLDIPEREWALDTLASWVREGDDAPSVLRERAAALGAVVIVGEGDNE